MHEMDKTPRILTIIGIIFEGVGVISSFFGYWLLKNFEDFPMVSAATMDVTQQEFDEMMEMFAWLADIIFVMSIIMAIALIVNLFVFTKLLRSNFDEETAKKVYLYQAIWGGINVLFNQVTAVMYLVSGVSGYSGHKEERNIREGI